MIKKHLPLCVFLMASLLSTHTSNGQPQVGAESASVPTEKVALKWNMIGLRQANTMGGGEAAISKNGKFRVFILMG